MGRIITQEKIDMMEQARSADPQAVGPALGYMLIKGNVPIEAAASALSVSEPTIYRWMYGQSAPRDGDKIDKVKRFMTTLRKAKRERDLPLTGTVTARLKEMEKILIKHKPVQKSSI